MSEQFTSHCPVSVADNRNVYKTIINDFAAHLEARGHSEGTQHAYLSALSHFVRWLQEKPSRKRAINSVSVCAFIQEHLPVCHCPAPVSKEIKTVRAALNQLLLMHGYERLLTGSAKGTAAVEQTLYQFDVFLRDVCGLTEPTRLNRQRQVRPFLMHLYGTGPVEPQRITPEVLVKFVTDCCQAQ